MIALTIDFAARFSAGMVLKDDKEILFQFDSWGKTPFEFIAEIVDVALRYKVDIIVVEDVPYGLSKQFMIKPVLRLQGILIHALGLANLIGITVFLNPATWQRSFEGVYGGKAVGAAAAALVFDYAPPDMLTMHADEIPAKGKERTKMREQLKKASTDYVDAFLMAKFTFTFASRADMLQKSGIQEISI